VFLPASDAGSGTGRKNTSDEQLKRFCLASVNQDNEASILFFEKNRKEASVEKAFCSPRVNPRQDWRGQGVVEI
jgi:hypothetical protein